MIADLDETIRQLLVRELPVKNGEIDIKFHQPTREWSSRLTRPTVNFFLYDVRENTTLRQHQWQKMGNGRDHLAHLKRTPYRVDCHYMITGWATEPEDEHRLLTRTLLALFRHPILPETQLVGQMRNQPFEVQAQLARHDRLTNPAEVWSALDNELRPSISYIVTLALDPWTEVTGPVVRIFTLRTGQTATLPREQQLVEETVESIIAISGTVYRQEEPQRDINVAIKGTGLVSTTDENGHFVLGMFPPGDYTLMAWPETGKPIEKSVTVPADNYDIDL